MLAARDQENLVHGHQAAAAAKPLNQGAKQLAPKTPGNKVPKTPFKIPLNDENGPAGFGGGKTGLKTGARGNENFMTIGKKGGLADKNTFVTPLGPRSRAPLGLKTTNAKAKAFQTPAPPIPENDLDKGAQKSATARKAKSKVSHAEMTKLEILGDKDELGDREIEYMPPRSIDLPDYPDDMPHDIDLSMFANGGLTRGFCAHYGNPLGDDGLTHHEREDLKRRERWDRMDKEMEETIQAQLDCIIPCTHYPSCPGDDCKDAIAHRKAVEAKQRKKKQPSTKTSTLKPALPSQKKPLTSKTPSTLTAQSAAAALSHPNPKPATLPLHPKAKLPSSSSLPFSKKQPPPSTNPSPIHPTAARLSSLTMGYAAGRATSASMRKSVVPASALKPGLPFSQKSHLSSKPPFASKSSTGLNAASANAAPEIPDTSLAPAAYIMRYGVPPVGSEKWHECRRCGCFDNLDYLDRDDDDEGKGKGKGKGKGEGGEEGEGGDDGDEDAVARGLRGGTDLLDSVLRGEEEEVGEFVW